MRRAILTSLLMLPLAACYVEPPAPMGYGYPPPPPAGYPPPAYPYAAYPGYSYNDGAPIIYEGGIPIPLMFFGGVWGWYDSGHVWHAAPAGVIRDLNARRAAGAQFHPSAVPQAQGWQREQAYQHYEGYRQDFHQTPNGYRPAPPPQKHEDHHDHQ